MSDPLLPDAPPPVIRIWSPLAVAMYGLVLAYPASLVLAVKNWRALGLRGRILPHIVGAFGLTLHLLGFLIFAPPRVGRMFTLAANVMAFVYIKERLYSDLREMTAARPYVRIERRPWYS